MAVVICESMKRKLLEIPILFVLSVYVIGVDGDAFQEDYNSEDERSMIHSSSYRTSYPGSLYQLLTEPVLKRPWKDMQALLGSEERDDADNTVEDPTRSYHGRKILRGESNIFRGEHFKRQSKMVGDNKSDLSAIHKSDVTDRPSWEMWQGAFFITSLIVLLLLLLLFATIYYIRRRWVHNASLKQWIFHPVVKPPVEEYKFLQTTTEGEIVKKDSIPCEKAVELLGSVEPIRIRAKGLLERRGSNASLKIELQPNTHDALSMPTPPRECTVEEYLLSAGNHMNRRQLRNCLKDCKSLQEEFWDIPLNHPEHTEVSGSGVKNRYKTILPNESTRVKLPEMSSDLLSSYINANYISGYDGEEKAYIATQGPLPHTITDFWHMVICERSPVIVMITKLMENGMQKCESYLPDGTEETYGDICVRVGRIEVHDGYCIREVHLQQGNLCHDLLHFWYTSWPDHKTPCTSLSLVNMATQVESDRLMDKCSFAKGPVVVHCSAGIGRTGCFIALSIGMRQLIAEDNVNVLGVVCSLRHDRGGMVQTGEQYEFIHRALCLYERMLPDHTGD